MRLYLIELCLFKIPDLPNKETVGQSNKKCEFHLHHSIPVIFWHQVTIQQFFHTCSQKISPRIIIISMSCCQSVPLPRLRKYPAIAGSSLWTMWHGAATPQSWYTPNRAFMETSWTCCPLRASTPSPHSWNAFMLSTEQSWTPTSTVSRTTVSALLDWFVMIHRKQLISIFLGYHVRTWVRPEKSERGGADLYCFRCACKIPHRQTDANVAHRKCSGPGCWQNVSNLFNEHKTYLLIIIIEYHWRILFIEWRFQFNLTLQVFPKIKNAVTEHLFWHPRPRLSHIEIQF